MLKINPHVIQNSQKSFVFVFSAGFHDLDKSCVRDSPLQQYSLNHMSLRLKRVKSKGTSLSA